MKNIERRRRWFRERTARLNALGLTSRGTPMKQRRRVYGHSKADYQREHRAALFAAGLTTRGTIPQRGLEKPWARFRASLCP